MDYLGFEVSQEGIRTSPEKVKAILDWPPAAIYARYSLIFGTRVVLSKIHSRFLAVGKALDRLN